MADGKHRRKKCNLRAIRTNLVHFECAPLPHPVVSPAPRLPALRSNGALGARCSQGYAHLFAAPGLRAEATGRSRGPETQLFVRPRPMPSRSPLATRSPAPLYPRRNHRRARGELLHGSGSGADGPNTQSGRSPSTCKPSPDPGRATGARPSSTSTARAHDGIGTVRRRTLPSWCAAGEATPRCPAHAGPAPAPASCVIPLLPLPTTVEGVRCRCGRADAVVPRAACLVLSLTLGKQWK